MDRGWRLARTLVFALLAFRCHVALLPPPPLSSAAAVAVFMLLCREFELNPCDEERRRTTQTMIWGVRVGRRWAAAEKEKSILLKKSLHSNSNINQFSALGCGGKHVGTMD
uniref:Secreted protein n=1 Tax=Oryza meridionalis TaxID=40149 RepID=A0A0E0C8U4_9ORYZ